MNAPRPPANRMPGTRMPATRECQIATTVRAAPANPAAAFAVRSLQPVDYKSFKATVFVPENCPLG